MYHMIAIYLYFNIFITFLNRHHKHGACTSYLDRIENLVKIAVYIFSRISPIASKIFTYLQDSCAVSVCASLFCDQSF